VTGIPFQFSKVLAKKEIFQMATQTAQTAPKASTEKAALAAKRNLRKKTRRAGKKKLAAKLHSDKEFAKTFFEARSKRQNEKKVAFRKKKARKK
jgi:hypothetical protein